MAGRGVQREDRHLPQGFRGGTCDGGPGQHAERGLGYSTAYAVEEKKYPHL